MIMVPNMETTDTSIVSVAPSAYKFNCRTKWKVLFFECYQLNNEIGSQVFCV